MHEKGVADDIFQALLAEARKAGATRITGAAVEVGELAGITPSALVHGIEHCAEHVGMAPFPVEVTVLQAQVRCAGCGATASPLGPLSLRERGRRAGTAASPPGDDRPEAGERLADGRLTAREASPPAPLLLPLRGIRRGENGLPPHTCPECGGEAVRVEAATGIRITQVEYE